MSTEKLYYEDSHLFEFTAELLRMEGNAAVLSRTAFFPGGGGQKCDCGEINGIRVTETYEKDGEIFHVLEKPCAPGEVRCAVDRETRLRRMQNHSAEHIVSGITHNRFGCDNVGFHMAEVLTCDFNTELSGEQIREIETAANEAVRANLKVRTWFPENAAEIEYRAKLDITENLRLVEIEGIDICACCVPHVDRTGEIGLIKILSYERHRGGTRITMTAGLDALDYVRMLHDSLGAIGASLSVPKENAAAAVEKLLAERDRLKYELGGLQMKMAASLADGGNCVFAELGTDAQRELCNMLMEKHEIAGVFCGGKYIIGSKTLDLRQMSGEINSAIGGRGGGKSNMIQGSYTASESDIQEYFKNVSVNKI